MRRPSRFLVALWFVLTLLPLPALLNQRAPGWSGIAFLLQVVLFLGVGYLGSGSLGYGTALVSTMVLGLGQLTLRRVWLGNWGFWWATLGIDLAAAFVGALLWRWREEHYGADFHFDLIAPWYERLIHPQDPTRLLEALQLTPESRVLDAGGGTGRVAQFLQPAQQLVVADLSVGMLRYAKEKPGVQAVAALTEQLPFPPATFDRIVMVDALHHVFQQEKSVQELWRVLAPGGRLIIEEPDFNLPIIKALALGEKILLMRSHFLKPEEIAALLPPEAHVEITSQSGMAHIIATKT
ncbi:MAG: methyltransferase domain-containing protein [Chloroflexi bacterium]|nr:methyltransferase domain-containing protein [Chloroflexota bacterium]